MIAFCPKFIFFLAFYTIFLVIHPIIHIRFRYYSIILSYSFFFFLVKKKLRNFYIHSFSFFTPQQIKLRFFFFFLPFSFYFGHLVPIPSFRKKKEEKRTKISLRKIVLHKQLIIQLQSIYIWKFEIFVKVDRPGRKKNILARLAVPQESCGGQIE